MAVTGVPISITAAEYQGDEVVVVDPGSLLDEGVESIPDDLPDIVSDEMSGNAESKEFEEDENSESTISQLGSVPTALEGYGYEQLQQVELVGAEPYGDVSTSHLYTLKAGESVTFADEMSGEVAYTAGDTLAIIETPAGETSICFRPVNYDEAKQYKVTVTDVSGSSDSHANLRNGGNGSYYLDHVMFGPYLGITISETGGSNTGSVFAGGSGTAEDPYLISTYDQLKAIGDQTSEGLYYKLTADITANDSAPDEDSTNKWTPVDPRACHLDGAGHTISNLCIGAESVETTIYDQTKTYYYYALFGQSGTVNELKDLTIENVHFMSKDIKIYNEWLGMYFTDKVNYSASLAINASSVTGCTLKGTVTGVGDIAGLVYNIVPSNGDTVVFSDNKNEANITSESGDIAGLAFSINSGDTAVLVCENNTNNGNIDANIAAGLFYEIIGKNSANTVNGCVNNGEIQGSEASGIVYSLGVGRSGAEYNGKITGCKNYGIISVDEDASNDSGPYGASGIIGAVVGGTVEISDCLNSGNITAKGAFATGICHGKANDGAISLKRCANTGNITGSFPGGIVAELFDKDSVTECYNSGNIINTLNDGTNTFLYTGGIAGYMNGGEVSNCFNAGCIDASSVGGKDSSVAGVVSLFDGGTIKNCYNVGEIRGGNMNAYAIAEIRDSNIQAGNCYYLKSGDLKGIAYTSLSMPTTYGGIGLTGSSMSQQKSFKNWDFTTVWQVGSNENYPYPELRNNPYSGAKMEVDTTPGTDDEQPGSDDPEEHEEPEIIEHQYVTDISLGVMYLTLKEGAGYTFKATVSPANAADTSVTLSSSDTEVLSVEGMKITAVKAGTATVTATANGAAEGESITALCTVTVKGSQVEPEDTEEIPETASFWIGGMKSSYTYTAAAIQPAFRLYYGDTRLSAGTDYTVTYKNNKAVRAAKSDTSKFYNAVSQLTDKKDPYIQITLKGNYNGIIIKPFSIDKKPLNDADITVVDAISVDTGKNQKLKPVLFWNGKAIAAKEYSLMGEGWKPSGYKDAGAYEITVKASENGSFTGEVPAKVIIKEKADGMVDLAKLKAVPFEQLAWGKTNFVYDGNEITPSYVLINGRNFAQLEETDDGIAGDYRVVYENNINVGTATARFIALPGSEKCYGSKTVTFKISKPAATDITKTAAKPNEDVTVTLLDSRGNEMETPSAVFLKGGVMPKVKVTVTDGEGPVVLTEGVDYKLSYKNNKAVADATAAKAPMVIVTGKGEYKGKAELAFSITPQDISKLNLTVDDIVLDVKDKQKPYAYQKTSWTLTDLDGKVLKMGKDYKIVKKGVKESHTADVFTADGSTLDEGSVVTLKLTATGSNYTGSISASYRVIAKDKSIKKAIVTLNDSALSRLIYADGAPVTLDESDLTVKMTKDGTPLATENYEIVSFTGNTVAGSNAKLTIRGKNGYGNMKTVSVKISPVS